jgi:hypothetical protein
MARMHDIPCPATAFTAEINAHLLAIEAAEARGVDLDREETAAALRMALALMQLAGRHPNHLRAGRR